MDGRQLIDGADKGASQMIEGREQWGVVSIGWKVMGNFGFQEGLYEVL